jgi:hypothetical protein
MLLLAGCVSIKPAHIKRDASPATPQLSGITRYAPPAASHMFKATLDIKKHHLTGLLIVKRMDSTSGSQNIYRVVFMNEIGMTFFDLEIQTDSFKVVSSFESLNKKALMNILETDFRILTWNGLLKTKKSYRQQDSHNLVLSGTSGKYQIWQTFSPGGDTLYTLSAKSNLADPVIIQFEKYSEGFPLKITLENPFIGMKLTLRKLKK